MAEPTITIERRKVKYARISIDRDLRIQVVIPLRYSQAELAQLLASKQAWIQKHIAAFSKKSSYRIPIAEGQLLFKGAVIEKPGGLNTTPKVLSWYKQEAKTYILQRLPELAGQFGFRYNRVFIRDTKSRWGSCSIRKNVSFNWRLIKAPQAVIDYVILHELAHTIHFNHSKQYWALVERICPEYKAHKDWLKKYGPELYL